MVLIFRLSLSYFSRYKEIAGRLEAAFSEGLAVAAGSVFHLQVSEVLWSCLAKCWSDKVYVPPLAHRLWKLTLQLYARYAKFLDEVLYNANHLLVPPMLSPHLARRCAGADQDSRYGGDQRANEAPAQLGLLHLQPDVGG